MNYKGRVWKFGDHVSTDLMMPGAAVLARPGLDEKAAAEHCMSANRPGWAAEVRPGDVLLAGRNFGCGSSRPAQRLLRALGIVVVVAESFSRLFFRNCINTGFPVLICRGVTEAFEEKEIAEVNLETGEVRNVTRGTVLVGEALAPGTPPYEILRAGGLRPLLEKRVRARTRYPVGREGA